MTITYIVVFLGASLASFLLTRTVRNLADARGMGFGPTSARHIHTGSISRLGGIAIFITFTVVAIAMVVWPGRDPALAPRTLLYILGPGALVFLLGLYDDFYPVKPHVKFAVQAVAATILFLGGFGVFQLPLLFGSRQFGWIGLPLTILWVLWITNAFNLLDGIDGLAAGSALFSTLTVFVVSLVSGNFLVSSLTLALAGAILGFLASTSTPRRFFSATAAACSLASC